MVIYELLSNEKKHKNAFLFSFSCSCQVGSVILSVVQAYKPKTSIYTRNRAKFQRYPLFPILKMTFNMFSAEKSKDICFSQAVKNRNTEKNSYPSLRGEDSTKFDSIEDRFFFFHLIKEKTLNWRYDFSRQSGYIHLVSVCLEPVSHEYFGYPTEPDALAGQSAIARQLAQKKYVSPKSLQASTILFGLREWAAS